WALGYQYVGDVHFHDNHTRAGLALLILYLVQMAWGTIIHFFKPTPQTFPAPANDTGATLTPPTPIDDTDKGSRSRLPSQSALSHSPLSSEAHGTTTVGGHSTMPLTQHAHAHTHGNAMRESISARPPQNYGHAVLGLSIIGLAFYNVHEGYSREWPKVFGQAKTGWIQNLKGWWVAWVIIIPCIYLIGLTLLPRQWKQEADARRKVQAPSGKSSAA
ncbi:hypothetical protein FRB90_007093, partial [Tulasnella sp. 427]